MSILLYWYSTWTQSKLRVKKLGNYTRMLLAILNNYWRQHPTKQQLYSHLTPIPKTIKVKRTRYAGHCWRSKDKLISNTLPWTSSYGQSTAGRPARTYIQQLCADTGYSLEDLPGTMDDRDGWRERGRESGRSVLASWHDGDDDYGCIAILETIYLCAKKWLIVNWIILIRER